MNNQKSNRNLLWKYAGLATQLLVGIGLALWLGSRLDAWLNLSLPLGVWLLPLLLIAAVMVKIIRDTSAK